MSETLSNGFPILRKAAGFLVGSSVGTDFVWALVITQMFSQKTLQRIMSFMFVVKYILV